MTSTITTTCNSDTTSNNNNSNSSNSSSGNNNNNNSNNSNHHQPSSSNGGRKFNLNLASLKLIFDNNNTTTLQVPSSNQGSLSPTSSSSLSFRNLFTTSPRGRSQSISATSPKASPKYGCGNGPMGSNSGTVVSNPFAVYNNIQSLPHQILESILYRVVDRALPSLSYIDLCLVSKHFHRVIESMRGFTIVFGISTSHTAATARWYKNNYHRVSRIKFVNNFFARTEQSIIQFQSIFINTFSGIGHDPSIDLSNNYIPREVLLFIIEKLKQSKYFTLLDLSNCTFDPSIDQPTIDLLFQALSNNTSIQYLNLNYNSILSSSSSNSPLLTSANNQNNNNQNSITNNQNNNQIIYRLVNSSFLTQIVYLNIGGFRLGKDSTQLLSQALRNNTSIKTFIYNNNPTDIKFIIEAFNTNDSITTLDVSSCQLFNNSETVYAFQQMIRINRTIRNLNISRNSFNVVKNSAILILGALSISDSIESIDLSATSPTLADTNLFPYIDLLFNKQEQAKQRHLYQLSLQQYGRTSRAYSLPPSKIQPYIVNSNTLNKIPSNNNNPTSPSALKIFENLNNQNNNINSNNNVNSNNNNIYNQNNNSNNSNNTTNIKSLIISNNYPFPSGEQFQKYDFLQNNDTLVSLNLSNLKLGDEKLKPIIESLQNNQCRSLKHLDLSINRLRISSSILIAEYLKDNDHLVSLNLSFNFLKNGVRKISQALHSNTTLKSLNLYATQIMIGEARSIVKLLSANKTITELNIGHNLQIDPVIKSLSSIHSHHQSLRTLDLCSTNLKNSFIKLIQRNHAITHIDITDSTFSKWKISSLSSALLKNKTLAKFNFSTEDPNILKLLSSNQKINTRLMANKFYYFK